MHSVTHSDRGVEHLEVRMGIKDIRRNYILERTIRLFCDNSIAEIKIKDVAAYCNIGEATFYRYFSKKTALIVACAIKLQEKVADYFDADYEGPDFLVVPRADHQ